PWRAARSGPALGIACKITYRLLPGESALSDVKEPLFEEDRYWDDDPARSLYAPGDFVPYKPRADVLLVGHAFAPGAAPAPSITARLAVQELDKTVEVSSERALTWEG